jgi:hypothetical protein
MAGGSHSVGGTLGRKAALMAGIALAVILILVANSATGHQKPAVSKSLIRSAINGLAALVWKGMG